jgi:hypothetical protein
MAYKKPRRLEVSLIMFGDCEDVGDLNSANAGSTRYCVTCDALEDGKKVILRHPGRAMTPDEAIAHVKEYNRKAFDEITNCSAFAILGSCKE